MRPIRTGDRGPAVEDVQRRLLALGADLGSTGVDGVFLGATCAAVAAFQKQHGLPEDGNVGPLTWAALVDATFKLGDRLLYLRYPYLHGEDVRSLQSALNALGFASGEADGIFGAFTERAAREFQDNTGLASDGIVGPDTVRTILNLRHIWADKAGDMPAALRAAPARRADVLARVSVDVLSEPATRDIADRLVNLALASEPAAKVGTSSGGPWSGVRLELGAAPVEGIPVVAAGDGGPALSRRLASALASTRCASARVAVSFDRSLDDEHASQALAVSLLDGLCLGLDASERSVVPWPGL